MRSDCIIQKVFMKVKENAIDEKIVIEIFYHVILIYTLNIIAREWY
jgi:hypothetical protein